MLFSAEWEDKMVVVSAEQVDECEEIMQQLFGKDKQFVIWNATDWDVWYFTQFGGKKIINEDRKFTNTTSSNEREPTTKPLSSKGKPTKISINYKNDPGEHDIKIFPTRKAVIQYIQSKYGVTLNYHHFKSTPLYEDDEIIVSFEELSATDQTHVIEEREPTTSSYFSGLTVSQEETDALHPHQELPKRKESKDKNNNEEDAYHESAQEAYIRMRMLELNGSESHL